ncbi:hypothetical protein DOY81_005732 [Sarcophaga bullata]|nr:hypothetical protein DOY81_005732 [Sarcophaga bullata]
MYVYETTKDGEQIKNGVSLFSALNSIDIQTSFSRLLLSFLSFRFM